MAPSERSIFINLPVADVGVSRAFFSALGFTFNENFCDATAICMRVNEGAYYMLLTHEKFAGFVRRPLATPAAGAGAIHAFSVASRDEVERIFAVALDAGGEDAVHIEDHGFMYSRSFYDRDGHIWEVFWMDPAAIPPEG